MVRPAVEGTGPPKRLPFPGNERSELLCRMAASAGGASTHRVAHALPSNQVEVQVKDVLSCVWPGIDDQPVATVL